MTVTTRFAPSPNGPLHIGHAWSAIIAHDRARDDGGRFLVRIEDIDGARSELALADEFRADLAWLGLSWDEVAPQSARLTTYANAAARLRAMGLLYPCSCTRAEIASAARALGPDGPLYPGTCRAAPVDPGPNVAWRLDVRQALRRTGPLRWIDERAGEITATPELAGDIVMVRKDPHTPASYHLAATLDDAADGVTVVTRGLDLFPATHVHRLLQALLGLPVPRWHHHALLMDAAGHKLAKRRGDGMAGLGLAMRRRAGEDGKALAEDLRKGRLPAGITFAETLHLPA